MASASDPRWTAHFQCRRIRPSLAEYLGRPLLKNSGGDFPEIRTRQVDDPTDAYRDSQSNEETVAHDTKHLSVSH